MNIFFILNIKQSNKLKIIKIETHVLSNQLEQSFFFSQWAYNERRICVVKIITEEGIYRQGSALMGNTGPIIGWPMLLGLSLIISNIWAVKSGEWKDAKQPFQLMMVGLAIIILASGLLGYSNTLS